MEGDRAALPFVHDLDLEAEQVAKLALEHLEIGINRLGRISGAGAGDVDARPRARFLAARPIFHLAYRQAPRDDLAGQRLGIVRRGDGAGMAHADIALQ